MGELKGEFKFAVTHSPVSNINFIASDAFTYNKATKSIYKKSSYKKSRLLPAQPIMKLATKTLRFVVTIATRNISVVIIDGKFYVFGESFQFVKEIG